MRAPGKGGERTTRKVTINYGELSDHEKEYFQVPGQFAAQKERIFLLLFRLFVYYSPRCDYRS